MKFLKPKKALCLFLSVIMGAVMMPISEISAATVLTDSKTGNEDGYDYELWKDSGNTTMTLLGNGAFSCEWSNINNALFRTGKKFDCTQTYKEIGNITCEYEVDYNPNGNSYLCLYGWTKEPLIEYYIVESWGNWRPPGTQSKGTITVDGEVYDIYTSTRVNQPSIIGNTTFEQYWSVRRNKSTTGTISVNKHFDEWEKKGMKMGKMYEAAFTVEGYQSSGKATVKKNKITIGGEYTDTPTQPTDPPKPVEPDKDGYYFHSTYESGTDSWTARGENNIATSSNVSFAGNQSLYVSGRTNAWNGAGYTLDTSVFRPGSTYSFGMAVMQNQIASEDFKLSLQYDLNGQTEYAAIAEGSASKGEWLTLTNTSYTIPAGASNLLLYVETLENLTNFYVDEAYGAPQGKDFAVKPNSKDGDVNHDGNVSIVDIIALQSYLLGKDTVVHTDTADLNKDGKLNAFDLAALKRYVLNLPVVEPEPEPTEPPTEPPTEAPPKIEGQWYNTADISWIDPNKPMVALSFDDGPVGIANTDPSIRIQNALANNGFHATFFYCINLWGRNLNSTLEQEILRAKDLGFEVANHTYSHPDLSKMDPAGIQKEINDCSTVLKRLTGQDAFLIRPPYLGLNDTVKANAGAPLITCAVDSQDWNKKTTQDMINQMTTKMNDGSLDNTIVLMHETYADTAAAVEYLAPYMKEKGWQIVTISEMFKVNNKVMYDGQVYTQAK
ncbi:MAG: hypothetical protein E7504_01145 [Ruminococcus sp.]|nr:hypothetical protein [Ruminococcus sp.]